jgi:hypothetical protein
MAAAALPAAATAAAATRSNLIRLFFLFSFSPSFFFLSQCDRYISMQKMFL